MHFIDSAKFGPIYDWLGDLVPGRYPGRFKPKLSKDFYGMVPLGVCLENFFPCTIVVPRPTFLLSNKENLRRPVVAMNMINKCAKFQFEEFQNSK